MENSDIALFIGSGVIPYMPGLLADTNSAISSTLKGVDADNSLRQFYLDTIDENISYLKNPEFSEETKFIYIHEILKNINLLIKECDFIWELLEFSNSIYTDTDLMSGLNYNLSDMLLCGIGSLQDQFYNPGQYLNEKKIAEITGQNL